MEHIKQAVEMAKKATARAAPPLSYELPSQVASDQLTANEFKIKEVTPDPARLESNRIIGYDKLDVRSKSFDMLRTQILQDMDSRSSQFLAVTSPSPGCGKTLTSLNLALSMGRLSERSIFLVDMDFEKPQVANYLGLKDGLGIRNVLDGRIPLKQALIQVSIGNSRLTVLPCEMSTINASEYMTSRAMNSMLQELKSVDRSRIIIFDMPPVLSGDNVISILPQIDCVLFVAALGITKASEIKECNKHLQSSAVIRVVLNKAADLGPRYY